jgi:Xaa-Pro aminopeptidase
MAIVAANGRSRQIVSDMEESLTRTASQLDEVAAYNEFGEHPIDLLADSLRELVGEDATVGLELDFVSHDSYARLLERLPKLRILPARDFFAAARMIKTASEIEALRAVGRAAHEAHYQALAATRAGDSELDIAARVVVTLLERGADNVMQLVIGSGERSWHANPAPTSRRLERGDMIRVDIFGVRNSYLSDVARTAVVGEPTREQAEIWKRIVELRTNAFARIKAGASTRAIYDAYARELEAFGFKPINFLGHGLGLTLHEEPYLNRYADSQLEAGMVLAIEPYLMLPDRNWGFQLEDEAIVTENGYELITDAHDDSELIRVAA